MAQINFFGTLYDALIDVVTTNILGIKEELKQSENPDEDNCEAEYFQKIKYVSSQEQSKQLSLNYDKALMSELDYIVWMEI